MLEVNNVSKSYDGKSIVKNLSLSIPSGHIVGIVGPSGCGKSTLLKCVAGLTKADSGSIKLNNIEYHNLSSNKLRKFRLENIGIVDQKNSLIADLDCLNNIKIILEASGVSPKQSTDKAVALLEILEISYLKDRFPENISGGEKQRVSIACSLANNPKLIVADEPTSSLDSVAAETVMRTYRSIADSFDVPIMIVTHDQRIMGHLNDYVDMRDFQ